MQKEIKIQTVHLFPLLDEMLIDLLQSLTDEEWHKQTIAKLWTVKDVSAHLLDGNVRNLSTSRDGYFGEKASNINSYGDLVAFLNNLNISWTNAVKRLSPKVLTHLLESTGKEYAAHLATLNPFADAVFSVAWAGHSTSPNWFHIAREYAEKFLHQQQIRDAVGKSGLLNNKQLSQPFFETFMYALPYTFRNTAAIEGTTVVVEITTEAGGRWGIVKEKDEWVMTTVAGNETALVKIHPNSAWKLFSKSWTINDVLDKVEIHGDKMLAHQALQMVAVMA